MSVIELLKSIALKTGPGYIQTEKYGRNFNRGSNGVIPPYTHTDGGHLYNGVVLLDYNVIVSKDPQDLTDSIDWHYVGTISKIDMSRIFNFGYTAGTYRYIFDNLGSNGNSQLCVYGCRPYKSVSRGKVRFSKVNAVKLSGGYNLYNVGEEHRMNLNRTRSPVERVYDQNPEQVIDKMESLDGFYSAEDTENGETIVRVFEINDRTEELNMLEYIISGRLK